MKRFLFGLFAICLITSVQAQEKKEFTLEDAMLKARSFYPESKLDLKVIPNTGNYVYLSSNYQELISGSIKSKKSEKTIASVSKINELTDENLALRHLYGATWIDKDNFVAMSGQGAIHYNVKKKKIEKIINFPSESANQDLSSNGSAVAYTIGNDVYIAMGGKDIQITNLEDGHKAGQSIARNEFGITKGTFWSPSGLRLAFYQKDETSVGDYPLLDITTTPGSLNNIKYPMAGQSSERASVGIFNWDTDDLVYLKSPTLAEFDYFTNLGWSPDDKYVTVAELNRDQNHMRFNVYDASNGNFVKTLFEEKNDRYVEPEHPAYFVSNSRFIWLSERDGQVQPFVYDLEKGYDKKLADNQWEIIEILGHDKSNLYVLGTGENPLEKHAYSISLKGGKVSKLTNESGTHSVYIDTDSQVMVDTYSSVDIPGVTQFKSTKGSLIRKFHTADNPMKDYKVSKPEISTITAADNKTTLYTRMIKPSDFDPNKKYPVLVYVYGGPHAQMITNSWLASAQLWMYYQAEQGYIIYTVDGRGSAHRNFEFESVIHRNVGDAEMDDQLRGVSYLKSLPYVDEERMAVHGWSYGGFMTTSLMLRHPEVFKVGVAGGPVTDWSYYEVMYGERYMDRPEENPEGYEKNRLMNYVENLQGDLLLIHGTIDDVVVMQHNLALVKAFIDAGVQMDFFPYPMHPHNVRGKDRLHLMRKVLTYVDDHLD